MWERPAVPKEEKVQFGEGILVYNFNPDDWEDQEMIPFGATRGGGSYSVEPTNQAIRFDGDKGEHTKGLKRRTEWVISITVTSLELDVENMEKFMIGETEEVTDATNTPNYKKVRPKAKIDDSDYLKNLAYITETKDGKVVAYVIENVLSNDTLEAAFEDKNEVTGEVTFNAHFDPNDMDTVPTYVAYYEAEQAV